MIVSVWDEHPGPKENMEIQEATIPKIQYRRMLIECPTLADLEKVREELINSGVPPHEKLEFSQWQKPKANWYIYASWTEG